MKKLVGISFIVMLSILIFFPVTGFAADEKVYHVPIENEVEKGLKSFLERAFNEAIKDNAKSIILEIHTPGGYVDAADEIGKLIDESTQIDVIAFINSKAHSAGAYIALHADKIYMVPDGTIGSAAVIDGSGNMASIKANSAWIKQMQAAAESTNRDPKYAVAMADVSYDMPEYGAPVGKLLTLSAEEALKVQYSEGTVSTIDELLKEENLATSEVIKIEPTFSEKLARFLTNPIVVTLLLTIATVGLMLELFTPGIGIPGIAGVSALGLFFFGHTVAGFAGYESVVLFVIGFVLVIAELFVPGGIIGIIGGAMMVTSLLFAGESMVYMAYSIVIALFIAFIGMVVLMKFFGKNLHLFNKLVLKEATTTEEGYVSNVNRIELLGKVGEAITPLRPSGTVIVDGERLDVVSEGGYIENYKKVEIIEVEGSRIVVREIKEGKESEK